MSLIAPSNLLALQSYTAPSQARPQGSSAAANEVFRPLDQSTGDLPANTGNQAQSERGREEVTVNLSQDAVRHLDAAAFAITDDAPSTGLSGTAPLAQANGQPQDDRPAPPGSRLDITI